MKFIKEVVFLLDKYKTERIEIIGNETKQETKSSVFYKGVKTGKIKTDEAALEQLYSSPSDIDNYKKFKSRFKARLVNTLLVAGINQPYFSNIQRAYYNCYKEWAAIRVLIGRSAKESATTLSIKTLRQALKYEFTELVVNLARELRIYYATVKGDRKKFQYYSELLKKHLSILEAELKAEEYYAELLIHFVQSKATKTGVHQKAKEYAKALKKYTPFATSYTFIYYANTVFVLEYEIINDYKNVIIECNKTIELLEQKSYNLKSQLFGFAFKAFIAHIKLQEYEQAKKMSRKCLETVEDGTINWFKFHQIYFNYLCHTQNFESLAEITYNNINHPNLQFQSTDTKETWKIYEAYTYFFCLINKVPESEAKEFFLKKFKLGKFLNEVPAFTLDKKGGNVHILTIQILILLAQKDTSLIIEKISALKRYSRRYLRKSDALYRSDCFINILILLPDGNFHKKGLKRHANKYIKKLLLVSMLEAHHAGEFEIIPYEFLVEILFGLCEG